MDTMAMNGTKHTVGDKKCPVCWEKFPRLHSKCGGVVHAQLIHDNPEQGILVDFKCDKCGEDLDDYQIYWQT